jgi:hypothetical protein
VTSIDNILEVQPLPFLRVSEGEVLQAIRVRCSPPTGTPQDSWLLRVHLGLHRYKFQLEGSGNQTLLIPEVESPREATFIAECGELRPTVCVQLRPVRRWTIHLVLHSHTDLGFTAPVSEVAQLHNENTDRAIEYCRETAHLPEELRFRWTCEVTWQVQNYIRDRAPVQVEALMQLVRANEIGIGALYSGQLTGLMGHEEAVRSIAYAGYLRNTYNIPCDTAMLCDVPGCTSGFVQILAKSGVSALIVADNNFIAPFLPRTDLPRPFLWQGHDSTEVLCWYTDHPFHAYVEGLDYGFLESRSKVEQMLGDKLLALEEQRYPFDRFQIQYAFDNDRITFVPAQIVREWATHWSYPRIKLSTAREFLGFLRQTARAAIPCRSGDWNDWWGGIVTGFPADEALSRDCHARIPAIETLSTQLALRRWQQPASDPRLAAAYDGILAFDEHSGGGNLWQPKSRSEQDQALAEGYGFLHSAVRTLRIIERSTLNALGGFIGEQPRDAKIGVYNPSGVSVSRHVKSTSAEGHDLDIHVHDLPPYSIRLYRQEDLDHERGVRNTPVRVDADTNTLQLTSPSCSVSIEKKTGAWMSFRDNATALELASPSAPLNAPCVYLVHPLCEVALGKFIPQLYDGTSHPGEFLPWPEHSVPTVSWMEAPSGAASCTVEHRVEGTPWLIQEYRVSEDQPGVTIVNTLQRTCVTDPVLKKALGDFLNPKGTLYFHFPFSVENAQFEYEATGAVLRPAEEQFKGSCHDFLAIQRWCALRTSHGGILLTAPDTPLVDVGSVGMFKFKEQLDKNPEALYFRAVALKDWGGPDESPYTRDQDFSFRFGVSYITDDPTTDAANSFRARAHRRAVHDLTPLYNVVPGSGPPHVRPCSDYRVFSITPDTVELMVMKPAESGRGWIIRLRETIGVATVAHMGIPGFAILSCQSAMMTEEPLASVPWTDGEVAIPLAPFSMTTLLLELVPREPHA